MRFPPEFLPPSSVFLSRAAGIPRGGRALLESPCAVLVSRAGAVCFLARFPDFHLSWAPVSRVICPELGKCRYRICLWLRSGPLEVEIGKSRHNLPRRRVAGVETFAATSVGRLRRAFTLPLASRSRSLFPHCASRELPRERQESAKGVSREYQGGVGKAPRGGVSRERQENVRRKLRERAPGEHQGVSGENQGIAEGVQGRARECKGVARKWQESGKRVPRGRRWKCAGF